MPERKFKTRAHPLEVREGAGDGEGVIVGIISTYDSPYDIGWGCREQIAPGAFAESLAKCGGRIAAYAQHAHVRGGVPIGYAEIRDTGTALEATYHLYLDISEDARAVYQACKDRVLREHSIGFWEDEVLISSEERDLETVIKGDLAETSIVLRGANTDTDTLDVRGASTTSTAAPSAPAETAGDVLAYPGSLSSPTVRRLVREQLADGEQKVSN